LPAALAKVTPKRQLPGVANAECNLTAKSFSADEILGAALAPIIPDDFFAKKYFV
jgi:hypothetical protein